MVRYNIDHLSNFCHCVLEPPWIFIELSERLEHRVVEVLNRWAPARIGVYVDSAASLVCV
jgi:hypothetical protein